MEKPEGWFNTERRKTAVLIAGVLTAAGTLLAAVVGVTQLFFDKPDVIVQPLTPSEPASPTQTSSPPGSPEPSPYEDYETFSDATGTIEVQVPGAWLSRRTDGWSVDGLGGRQGRIGPGLNAAPNVEAWFEDDVTPGVFVGTSAVIVADFDPDSLAAAYSYEGCVAAESSAYAENELTGASVTWTCAGSSKRWVSLAAWPDDHSYLVLVQAKLIDARDDEALDRILDSLRTEPPGA